jgi:glycosyltransferase involved in cell wall biosynthesis
LRQVVFPSWRWMSILRLTIVQYAGDYREAFERFSSGGKETYYAQRYSVNLVGSLAQRIEQVAVICAVSETPYDSVLANGVRAIGAGLKQGFHPSELIPLLNRTQPTRLSLTTPMIPILKWASINRIRTIAPLADSFQKRGLRNFFRHRLLAYYLNHPIVEWVGNHGISACLSLLNIGVSPDKIVPWDWPASHRPLDYTPRSLRDTAQRKLFYVGSITPAKGVGDLLRAMVRLQQSGSNIRLSLAGRDTDGAMAALAKSLNVDNLVDFLGQVPNEDVPRAMREADLVVIPSRHEYPEGLPLTIYEALSARTPIVASDHPMFQEALVDGESAVIYPAGDVDRLVKAIGRLLCDASLYAELSARSEEAWKRIQLPVTMGALMEAWIADDPAHTHWIKDHCLHSGRYDERISTRRPHSDVCQPIIL